MNARHLTVRNVPSKVMSALDAERKRRGASLNQTVIDLLKQATGTGGPRSNGLARHAGKWPEKQFEEFQAAVQQFEKIDPELWR